MTSGFAVLGQLARTAPPHTRSTPATNDQPARHVFLGSRFRLRLPSHPPHDVAVAIDLWLVPSTSTGDSHPRAAGHAGRTNERRPGGRPARQDIHLCSSVDSCATCKARSRYEDPAQDHNRALTLTTSMPGDPQKQSRGRRTLGPRGPAPRHRMRAGRRRAVAATVLLRMKRRTKPHSNRSQDSAVPAPARTLRGHDISTNRACRSARREPP